MLYTAARSSWAGERAEGTQAGLPVGPWQLANDLNITPGWREAGGGRGPTFGGIRVEIRR